MHVVGIMVNTWYDTESFRARLINVKEVNRNRRTLKKRCDVTRTPGAGAAAADRMAPDLLIALGANPETYRENNGYIISEQGKPRDFVLEIASRSTGHQDVVEKRAA